MRGLNSHPLCCRKELRMSRSCPSDRGRGVGLVWTQEIDHLEVWVKSQSQPQVPCWGIANTLRLVFLGRFLGWSQG